MAGTGLSNNVLRGAAISVSFGFPFFFFFRHVMNRLCGAETKQAERVVDLSCRPAEFPTSNPSMEETSYDIKHASKLDSRGLGMLEYHHPQMVCMCGVVTVQD